MLFIKIRLFFARLKQNEKVWHKINMIAQLAFGVGVVVVGALMLFTMIYNLGKYPADLTAVEESYWYDETTDTLLSVRNQDFTLISNETQLYIEGMVTDSQLITDFGSIDYNVSDGRCTVTYQTIEYNLQYYNEEASIDIVRDFESRLVNELEQKTE